MGLLKLRSASLNELDAFFFIARNIEVELLSVSSHPTERVDIAIFLDHLGSFNPVKVCISCIGSLFDCLEEHFQAVSVQYLNISSLNG